MPTKRKQIYLAVIGSVGIHLFVLFAWAFAVQWFPAVQAAPSQPPEQIKLQVVEEKPEVPPTPDPELVFKTPPPKPFAYKDSADLAEASQPPKDAVSQSDRNAAAASERPATDDKPLPTQRGKQVPRFAFDTHPLIRGDEGATAGQNVPENIPPTDPPPPRPAATPPLARASPPPASTPAADPRDLAMVTPDSIPANPTDAEPNPYDPSFRTPAGMTEPPRPTPVPRRGGYQARQTRTETTGGIDKPGADSVASEASPAGIYIASVRRAANLAYTKFVDARADIITTGIVRVHFTVGRDGRVLSARVVANNANEALASVSLRAVTDAKMPPMPTEVAATLDGILDMSIVFTLEDNGN